MHELNDKRKIWNNEKYEKYADEDENEDDDKTSKNDYDPFCFFTHYQHVGVIVVSFFSYIFLGVSGERTNADHRNKKVKKTNVPIAHKKNILLWVPIYIYYIIYIYIIIPFHVQGSVHMSYTKLPGTDRYT